MRRGLGGKRNKRFDVLLDVLIETMPRLLAPAMYDVSFDKARKHMAPVVIRAVRFRNNLQTMHPLEDKEEGIFIIRQGDKLLTVRWAGESGV
eukprot:g83120.t1